MEVDKAIDDVEMEQVLIDNESYYKISNVDKMRPFLMSIVSESNHWMFISSNGGLSAGRKDAEHALFPYYTDDKITELYDTTGSKSIFQVSSKDDSNIWEPFSERNSELNNCTRNLYKNFYGNKILFEEVNHQLGLTFRYQWSSSNQNGFVRRSRLINNSAETVNVKLLDGIQNIMPCGVSSDLQGIRSNLVDAYKKNELEADVGLGIYTLSAIIVDRAEPSEALKANIVWSIGLDNPTYLLSSSQVDSFRKGIDIIQEVDVKAEKGAYFVSQEISLDPEQQKDWLIVANINQGPSAIAEISNKIRTDKKLEDQVLEEIEEGTERLIKLVASSDGIQFSADNKRNTRHYANTLFNIMRGGVFDNNYQIEKWDFEKYLFNANKTVPKRCASFLDRLPITLSIQSLKEFALKSEDADFIRLTFEYLPLKFSRRHGDPSRPWNKFSINTRSEIDGSKILDYEGNWRDIFQNWEALGHSYPEYIDGMIFKFLNASTFDGYNPYRVTKNGFDWEVIEEHDPWSYIGYWGDHQIIYLLKFLEFIEAHFPGRLATFFDKNLFVYANVPYKIKSYEDILKNPKDTIVFDYELDASLRKNRLENGSDGALVQTKDNQTYRVNFIEKILATTLAKLSNFIPEAGIWLNTQRPEWNDANNALVGNGVSMVTLYYLRRFLSFLKDIVDSNTEKKDMVISSELNQFFRKVYDTFIQFQSNLSSKVSNSQRKLILDGLGMAGSEYRNQIYAHAFSGSHEVLKYDELSEFIEISLKYLDHSIHSNKRHDKMYHAYNLMTVEGTEEVSINHLDEMLEGQVAVLSSGYLSSKDALELLDSLKKSKLFREDQYSYLLYPNKQLSRFVDKNVIPKEMIDSSSLLQKLLQDGNTSILECDVNGKHHFNGNFNNAENLKIALDNLSSDSYAKDVEKDRSMVLGIYEEVFNHKAFTGRSGTFFGYEGLGSIYWHMVSKLLLAVEECCLKAVKDQESEEIIGRLMEHYYEINEGIGVHKSPELYGAFSTDPYSHTPAGKGAQQPGMTGQVKEDILSRMGELGIFVINGTIQFNPCLLRAIEFLETPLNFEYIDINQQRRNIPLAENSLAFTYCQVPIIYNFSDNNGIEVVYENGKTSSFDSLNIDVDTSQQIFSRTGEVHYIKVDIKKNYLK